MGSDGAIQCRQLPSATPLYLFESVSHRTRNLSQNRTHTTSQPDLYAFGIGVIALLFRLYQLDTFLTIDELKWAEGAAQFLKGLLTGQFALTYWHFHPGTTITWGSALLLGLKCRSAPELISCAEAQTTQLAAVIGWLRLSPVLWSTLGVVLVYSLGRWVLDKRIALWSSLFLAVDPFFVAHSRILNGDAVAGIFMGLSLLAFVGYMQHEKYRWLIGSAVLGGLAISTKLPAPILGLYITGLGLIQAIRHHSRWYFWAKTLLLWNGLVGLTVVLLWPALWVNPIETVQLMYHDAFAVGEVGAGHATYFLGETTTDPHWFFYPYVLAFRLTPVVCLGLLLGAILIPSQFIAATLPANTRRQVTVWVSFVLFVIVMANFSPKKLDRYIISVIPPLIILSIIGLELLLKRLSITGVRVAVGLFTMAWLFQSYFSVQAAPYYLTYYNPLLGGVAQAKQTIPVGWGEGLELAAHYLNQQPQANQRTASAWYSDIFQPYFIGQRASFSDDGRGQLAADYVIFYINQLQRQKPDAGLIAYIRRQPLLFAVDMTAAGFPITATNLTARSPHWVEVYRGPAAQPAQGSPTVEGIAKLLAYRIQPQTQALSVTLFLRVLGELPPQTTLRAALTDYQDPQMQWGIWQFHSQHGSWAIDQIVEWKGRLMLPADLPASSFRLWLAFQFDDGTVIAQFPISEREAPIKISP